MKNILTVSLALLALVLLACCAKDEKTPAAETGAHRNERTAPFEGTVYEMPVIDSASLDVDGDGKPEQCVMLPGPTSGLNSVVIRVSRGGEELYRATFFPFEGAWSFGEKDGLAQIMIGGEPHRLCVKDGGLFVEGLEIEE